MKYSVSIAALAAAGMATAGPLLKTRQAQGVTDGQSTPFTAFLKVCLMDISNFLLKQSRS